MRVGATSGGHNLLTLTLSCEEGSRVAAECLIIRPFGKKDVPCPFKDEPPAPKAAAETENPKLPIDKGTRIARLVEVDFDDIHKRLIVPALAKHRIDAKTTEVILSAGNIREDMFHLLMTADLVVADVTMYNANVFYELGIRHAFRDKFTFLIRSKLTEIPFDLRTDRYFEYDHLDPVASVDGLAEAIKATLNSERSDSPVFRLLPRMRSEDRSRFIAVPREFKEELERARKNRRGGDLRLLAAECEGFLWEIEGLREVGRAQFDLNHVGGACATWEQIVRRYPDDIEANMVLTTLYQRLNDTARSEQSLARAMRQSVADVNTAAEIQSLAGRNLRARWFESWRKKPVDPLWQPVSCDVTKEALCSPYLRSAYEAYAESFRGNLNYINSGLNALSLLLARISLAARHPQEWDCMSSPGELERLREESVRLAQVLGYAIECEQRRLEHERRVDFWFLSQKAAFLALTSDDSGRVQQAYREALAWAPLRGAETMWRSLGLHKALGVERHWVNVEKRPLKDGESGGGKRDVPSRGIQANIESAWKILNRGKKDAPPTRNVVLFAGLRMEPLPRPAREHGPADEESKGSADSKAKPAHLRHLPNTDATKKRAQEAIREKLKEVSAEGGPESELLAMASGGSGADLLFHDVCRQLRNEKFKIESRMYLAVPKDQYVGHYVAEAGPEWIDLFNSIYSDLRVEHADIENGEPADEQRVNVLVDSLELPGWLQGRPNYSIGRRTELWMLQHALVQRYRQDRPDTRVTLIVLWSPSRAESGGLEELIRHAAKSGVKVLTIDCSDWECIAERDAREVSKRLPGSGKADAAAAGAVSGGVVTRLPQFVDRSV